MIRLAVALLALLVTGLAQAQTYPAKPVRMIIPFPPGGSNDVIGRAVGMHLAERLGQGVIIDNRGGGGGIIGIDAAAKSPADGYTLLLISTTLPMTVALSRLPTDIMKSFTPIALLGTGPSVLAVPPSQPVHSVKELIALAKAKPGQLNAASAGIGSFQHLATELFRLQAGIDFVIVQYKGGGPALTDTIAGVTQMNLGSMVQILPHIRSGKLRALGVGSARRNPALPDVPTLSEAGVPGYEANNWWGMLAPAGTPPEALAWLHREIVRAVESPEVSGRLAALGYEPKVHKTRDEFAALISSDLERFGKVIKEVGIRAE